MAVVIRLSRIGKKGERKFRVVVKEKRSRRDGDYIALLGWYEMGKDGGKKKIDMESYNAWLKKGALPSPRVVKVISS
ncbi:MAG: 30S ribosomal protein S16 [Candidatus Levybacteria bacterium]|nr:30S ribosomal protein S16 [Candidatus Levybacteria bacterium]